MRGAHFLNGKWGKNIGDGTLHFLMSVLCNNYLPKTCRFFPVKIALETVQENPIGGERAWSLDFEEIKRSESRSERSNYKQILVSLYNCVELNYL